MQRLSVISQRLAPHVVAADVALAVVVVASGVRARMARKRPGRPRKPGRPKKASTTRSRRSSGRKRNSNKFIKNAIKRPGALSRAKKNGESTRAAAQRLKKSGSARQKRQANFYLNVLSKANRKRRK